MVEPVMGSDGSFALKPEFFLTLLQSETPVYDLLTFRTTGILKPVCQIIAQIYRYNDEARFNNVDSDFSIFLEEKDTDANERAVRKFYTNNSIKPLVDNFLRYTLQDRVHFIDRCIVYGLRDLYSLVQVDPKPRNPANKPAYYTATRKLHANSRVGEGGAAFKAAVNKFLMTLYVYSLYFKEEDPNEEANAQKSLLNIMRKLGGRRTRRQRQMQRE